jgi:hypothetical protein
MSGAIDQRAPGRPAGMNRPHGLSSSEHALYIRLFITNGGGW